MNEELKVKVRELKGSLLKEYSDTEIDEAVEMLFEHEMKHVTFNNINGISFYIAVSGKEQVYFTLWKETPKSKTNSMSYVCNLSTNLVDAAKKALKICGVFPIDLVSESNFKHQPAYLNGVPVIHFGKYKGLTLDEIYEKDTQYILYLSKANNLTNFSVEDIERNYKHKGKKNVVVYTHVKMLADKFFAELTEKNEATSKSEFIGELNKRDEFEVEILNVYYNKVTASIGEDLVKFYVGETMKDFVEKGAKIKVKATPKKHYEAVGKKYTYVNRVAMCK